jgi:large-conductance mechanosensitive channel
MKTKTPSKKTLSVLLAVALFSGQNMLAQQNVLAEDTPPTHSVIFIFSVAFFVIGFIILLVLKLRNDEKEKREEKEISPTKHRHHHPNHYGHGHQYHH